MSHSGSAISEIPSCFNTSNTRCSKCQKNDVGQFLYPEFLTVLWFTNPYDSSSDSSTQNWQTSHKSTVFTRKEDLKKSELCLGLDSKRILMDVFQLLHLNFFS
jgi:hypothetical protein